MATHVGHKDKIVRIRYPEDITVRDYVFNIIEDALKDYYSNCSNHNKIEVLSLESGTIKRMRDIVDKMLVDDTVKITDLLRLKQYLEELK